MKDTNVEIGMKVVPTQKTVKDWGNLEESSVWNTAKNGQGFLYVNRYCNEESTKAWELGVNSGDYAADYFNACDFEPFVVSLQQLQKTLDEFISLENRYYRIELAVGGFCVLTMVGIEYQKSFDNVSFLYEYLLNRIRVLKASRK